MRRGSWTPGLLAASLLVVVSLLAVSCGNDDAGGGMGPPGGGDVAAPGEIVQVRSDVEREEPGTVATTGVVDGDTAFALELYRELVADDADANLFFSPYSISVALAMTLPGARGQTWDEMAAMLRATEGEEWHRDRNALDRHLLRERPSFQELQPLELEIANSLWGQTGYPFRQDFLDLLARHYGTGLTLVDFATAWEEARAAINAWVEEATNDRIVDLIPEGAIDDLTRLVLVNAIFFKANWVNQFDPTLTTDGTFRAPGGEVTAPMMRQAIRTLYGEGNGWQAIRLPYAGEASMLIIAPEEETLSEMAGSLDAARLGEVRAALGDHIVDLTMPRFEYRSQFSLPDVLERLGMVEAFVPPRGDTGADLTGMVDVRELFVSDVVHQAFVSVDEEGTEAAAATAVIVSATSMPMPATLTLDRPFIFIIEDDLTGAILFVGQVTDPST
jgi:serpin B